MAMMLASTHTNMREEEEDSTTCQRRMLATFHTHMAVDC